MYKLLIADNIELRNAKVKAEYADKVTAVQALYTEISLATAQFGLDGRYTRFLQLDGAISADFGSWHRFVGLSDVTLEDLR